MTRPLFKPVEGWAVATLEADLKGEVVVEVGSGGTPPTEDLTYWGGTISWLTPKEMTENDSNRYVYTTERTINEKGLEKAGRLWPIHTIMLTKRAPVGFVKINKVPITTNQGILCFRCGNRLVPEFLYYWLSTNTPYLDAVANGSTYPELYPGDLFEFEICLPPVSEQRTIATILGAMDDKIDLNRKMNKTLEEMAQATFKNWFIDFEPFRGQGMQNSPLGEIPVGWQVEKLETIAEFTKGLSYRSDELQESETALVTLKSIARGGGYQQEGLKPFIGDYKAEQQIAPGEVVLAHTDLTQAAEVLGRAARVQPNPKYDNLVASLDLVIVRPKEQKATNVFLYSLLSQRQYVEHALGYANGTTVLHLSKNALPEYEFILPPSPIIEKYSELVEPIFKQIDLNENQSNLLFKIRDTLLPKLVSGEIRVKETDKFVEEVA